MRAGPAGRHDPPTCPGGTVSGRPALAGKREDRHPHLRGDRFRDACQPGRHLWLGRRGGPAAAAGHRRSGRRLTGPRPQTLRHDCHRSRPDGEMAVILDLTRAFFGSVSLNLESPEAVTLHGVGFASMRGNHRESPARLESSVQLITRRAWQPYARHHPGNHGAFTPGWTLLCNHPQPCGLDWVRGQVPRPASGWLDTTRQPAPDGTVIINANGPEWVTLVMHCPSPPSVQTTKWRTSCPQITTRP